MIVNAYDAIGWVSTMALLGWFLWLVFKEPLLGKRPPESDTTSSYKEPEPLWRMQRRGEPRLRRRRKNGKAQKKVQA